MTKTFKSGRKKTDESISKKNMKETFRLMNLTKQHKKVILVIDGAAGSSYAFTCQPRNCTKAWNYRNSSITRCRNALDLSHALALTSPKKIYAAEYADCADADLVVITAGAPQKPGETHTEALLVKTLRSTNQSLQKL